MKLTVHKVDPAAFNAAVEWAWADLSSVKVIDADTGSPPGLCALASLLWRKKVVTFSVYPGPSWDWVEELWKTDKGWESAAGVFPTPYEAARAVYDSATWKRKREVEGVN